MAITTIDKTLLTLNTASEIAGTAKTGTFGIDLRGGDYKTLITINNASGGSATLTLEAGDGCQGGGDDLVVTVANGKTSGIVVDSGYFKKTQGEYKGYIKATASASLTVTVIELPQ